MTLSASVSPSPTVPPAVHIAGVSKRFGDFAAVSEVSLDIQQGEFFALLGPNGAGKTTLISMLAGLARPSSGRIEIMGYDVSADYRATRSRLGVVPQELVFDPFFTVREILRNQSGYFGLARNDDWIDELLHHLDLTHKANDNMRMLSGGMKRRVLVAQALVHRPPVIVLDEPTAGVDVELRQGLWHFIRALNEAGHTILLTTHYLEEAQTLCRRIAMLKAGRIVALDTTANLLNRFATRALRVRVDKVAIALMQGGSDEGNGWLRFGFDAYSDVEGVLHRLATAGVKVEAIELGEPDLEHVFIEVMKNA